MITPDEIQKEFEMPRSTHCVVGWVVGRWLVTLQAERIEQANPATPADDEGFIDWDALADQYGVPASADGGGLQMCARCGQSVAPGSGRSASRTTLGDFSSRIGEGYRYPAGAYRCAKCKSATLEQGDREGDLNRRRTR
jgi:hypothetical protein